MLKAARISALILLLACSARAGYMQSGSPEPPPSQPASEPVEPTDDSQTTSANDDIQNEEPGALTQVALDVFAVLPSLL